MTYSDAVTDLDPAGRRFVVSNGDHWNCAPFDWSVAELIPA